MADEGFVPVDELRRRYGEAAVEEFADAIAEKVAARLAEQPDTRSPLTAKQVAERLAVSERTARDLIDRGVLPSFKVGEWSRRVDQATVDAYLDRQRASG